MKKAYSAAISNNQRSDVIMKNISINSGWLLMLYKKKGGTREGIQKIRSRKQKGRKPGS